jgi:hypothetical protein
MYHMSACSIKGTKIVCMLDYDGMQVLDYAADGPSVVAGTLTSPVFSC